MPAALRLILLTFFFLVIAVCPSRAQGPSEAAYFEFSVSPWPETFIFKLTNPERIQEARDILSSGTQQKIVIGTIIKQPVYYNLQWSFHYDPQTIGFATGAIEVCDSTILNIENDLDHAYPQWCPWGTRLLREVAPPPVPGPGNIPPTISMTFPYADDTYGTTAPASVTIKANADDADGTISRVEFFNDETKIGEATAAPYTLAWNNLAAGTYTVSAVATDNLGASRPSFRSVRFTVENYNYIDGTAFFVNQHYRDFFNRVPDEEGFEFWCDNIESCGQDAACREVKRIDTSAAYFLSIEFQETGYLVHRFYKASFGRRPLFAEFLEDTQAISDGVVVNAPGWQQLLENNKRAFVSSWVTREAFTSIYDNLSNEQFVDTLVTNTGATFSETDRAAFVDVLNSQALTRAQVLRIIVENEGFYRSEYNVAFVEMQYFGYLRRNPQDPPNSDLSGFNFWLNKLNEFDGDFRKAEMVKAFLVSGEYRQRFGTP